MHLRMVYGNFHATTAAFSWERPYGLKILNPFIIWPFMGKKWQPLYCNSIWHCSVTQSRQSCPTLGDFMNCIACQASLSLTISWGLLKLMSIQWCHPTILFFVTPSPPALSLSQHQGLFQWVSSSPQVDISKPRKRTCLERDWNFI